MQKGLPAIFTFSSQFLGSREMVVRRFSPKKFISTVAALALLLICVACSSGNVVHVAVYAVPSIISITPAGSASLSLGDTGQFTGTALDSTNKAIAEPIYYQSTNPAVVTIASNGLACAGSWDSLTAPEVCTPGQTGTAVITANAQGVSSPSVTVYVHQPIDRVVISPAPGQLPPVYSSCFSKEGVPTPPQFYIYQANAYSAAGPSGPGTDITSTVGPFTWQSTNPTVATLKTATISAPILGLQPGQTIVTANIPGTTSLIATVNSVNSAPYTFETCPVQSISVYIIGANNSMVVPTGSKAQTIIAKVFDNQGVSITGVPITWCSSDSLSVGIGGTTGCFTSAVSTTSVYGATVTATPSAVGNSSITASCTPPNCNIGFTPSLPIYPEGIVNMVVVPASGGTSTSETAKFYVSSEDCGANDGCVSQLVSIPAATNILGTAINLPATPNSLVFNAQGTTAYLGTDSARFGNAGLMVYSVSGSNVKQYASVAGKVLAVSPDGSVVIVSDTVSQPNVVYVLNSLTNVTSTLAITGATAAAFSPDSLKAYIVAGSTLYVYSKEDAIETIPLGAPSPGVSFLPIGAFAFLSGGAPGAAFSTYTTCDSAPGPTVTGIAAPAIFQALPNSTQVLAVEPPNVTLVDVSTVPVGCSPTLTTTLGQSVNLGEGNFTPTQLILGPDGNKSYIVASNAHSIFVFDILGLTSTALPLVGNATPVQAALSPDGTLLYVAASDGLVHVVSTVLGGDLQQINFPTNLCEDTAGNPYSTVCKPNLLVVQP